MNEAETRAEHIDPALKAAGWSVVESSRVLREHGITQGRLQAGGKRTRAEIADYVLVYRNTKLAVIEAKGWDKPHTEGVAQAKSYAAKLSVRFTYATNGQAIYAVDMATGAEGDVGAFPSRTRFGRRPLPRRILGVIASLPFRLRTTAVAGRGATTKTPPLAACSRQSQRARTASCSP